MSIHGSHMAKYFLFDRIEEGVGERVALRYGARSYTYEVVADKSRRVAALLAARGVRRGERVLIVLPDTPPFAWVLFGVLARGAVVAMGNPEATAASIQYLVTYTRATAVVTTPAVAEMLAAAGPSLLQDVLSVLVVPNAPTGDDPEGVVDLSAIADGRFVALSAAIEKVEPLGTLPDLHVDEPAMWLFTSGSTGEPKANIHAHRDFLFNTEVYAKQTVGYRDGDVTVSVPRLYFGYATGTNLFFPFAVAGTAGLFSERPTPESLTRAVAMYRPSVVTNVPTMLGKLLDHDAELRLRGDAGLDFASVRFSLSAGEALPEPLLRRWLERFGSDVYDGIGSAEMFHIYASNRPGDVRPGSLGKAVDGYELRVLPEDADGPGAAPCAPGEIGVLWVKGDSVSMGYWLDREKTFATFYGHWCKTGDLFSVDDDGYLYFAGRADDLLKVGGQWLAPREVEECLTAHGAVAEVAVIGVDRDGLVLPKAFVALRAGHDPSDALARELQEWCRTRLVKYKYPRDVEFLSELPKNDRGKVDKKALKARESA